MLILSIHFISICSRVPWKRPCFVASRAMSQQRALAGRAASIGPSLTSITDLTSLLNVAAEPFTRGGLLASRGQVTVVNLIVDSGTNVPLLLGALVVMTLSMVRLLAVQWMMFLLVVRLPAIRLPADHGTLTDCHLVMADQLSSTPARL